MNTVYYFEATQTVRAGQYYSPALFRDVYGSAPPAGATLPPVILDAPREVEGGFALRPVKIESADGIYHGRLFLGFFHKDDLATGDYVKFPLGTGHDYGWTGDIELPNGETAGAMIDAIFAQLLGHLGAAADSPVAGLPLRSLAVEASAAPE